MTPLLEAAVAARDVGLDVPECTRCPKHAVNEYGDCVHWCQACGATGPLICTYCHATGINPDPALLGWVALMWLHAHKEHVLLPWDTDTVETVRINPENFMEYYGHDREAVCERDASHDGTPAGLATALLRLVARVGGHR